VRNERGVVDGVTQRSEIASAKGSVDAPKPLRVCAPFIVGHG
jgi:hypothetical protein